jgi:hypothetical protein
MEKCKLATLASETPLDSPTVTADIKSATSLGRGSIGLPSLGSLQTRQKSSSVISLGISYRLNDTMGISLLE